MEGCCGAGYIDVRQRFDCRHDVRKTTPEEGHRVIDGTAPTAPARTPATDEVLRRIGRNLVIYQQVEQALKVLMTHARFHAPISQFAERFDRHAALIDRRTMGDLAGRLVDKVLQPPSEEAAPGAIDEAWFGFRFSVETDAQTAARHEVELKELVDRRNELVHHFLPRWQAAVGGDAELATTWLDAQREAAVAMLERLRGWARTMETARKEQAALLASDEGQRQMELLYLRSSRLVVMLGQVAMATPRADGWTLLSTAGHLIKRQAPDELEDLRGRFGLPSLKAVLSATELFDLAEEQTPGGGARTIFRINPHWRLEVPRADQLSGEIAPSSQ